MSSWRVDGRLHGLRIRKNFSTREEAAAEKATLELKAVQTLGGARVKTSVLADDQLREAEAVFQRLKDLPKTLSFYVDFAVANYREPAPAKPLAEAAAVYLATKTRERERTLLSEYRLPRGENHPRTLTGALAPRQPCFFPSMAKRSFVGGAPGKQFGVSLSALHSAVGQGGLG